jgi:hypothetical protein
MDPTPQEPSGAPPNPFESGDVVDILLDGPGDATRRPRRKNIPGAPPWWEEQFQSEKKPEDEKKPDGDQPKAP